MDGTPTRAGRAAGRVLLVAAATAAHGVLASVGAAQAQAVDVVVYGSTAGGFCAAVAAAREGARVVLVEPTRHLGGLATGGLSHSDSNQMVRSTVMGLFHEWHTRIVADYTARGLPAPYDPTVKDQARWTYEPHVAMRVTRAMLAAAGVEVVTGQPIASVQVRGTRIVALHAAGRSFHGRVFVDGTYEGDLMAASGVSWTIGREGRAEYGESLAGRQYPKPVMAIDGYGDDGEPLPLVTATERGDDAAGDERVMTYSYRLCLTRDPANRIPFPEPEAYDPARFELLRRHLASGGRSYGFDLYPLPGDKFDGNNSIGRQFSIGLVGGGNTWHAVDEIGREAIRAAHRQYTLEFLRFLTTDPAVPPEVRERYAGLGLCRDEFAEHGHFPPALYVRESRRMRGCYVLTQDDVLVERTKPDPIAVSSFPIDSHDVRRIALEGGGVVDEGTIFPVRVPGTRHGHPYQVPYRAVLPRPEQCTNLVVPVALSCTHVAMSSLRIEGTWMVIGQGAGVAAALAARRDLDVQAVAYETLRQRLLLQGQVLDLPAEVVPDDGRKDREGLVLDDEDAELDGPWSRSRLFRPYVGVGYRHDDRRADGRSRAVFRFEAPAGSGRYELRMAYSPHPTRASNVGLEVVSGPHRTVLEVDQRIGRPRGRVFRTIGSVELVAGTGSVLSLANAGTDGFVILDAFQLVRAPEEGAAGTRPGKGREQGRRRVREDAAGCGQ